MKSNSAPLSVLCVFAVDLHVKEVHRRVAENAEEAQRGEIRIHQPQVNNEIMRALSVFALWSRIKR